MMATSQKDDALRIRTMTPVMRSPRNMAGKPLKNNVVQLNP